MVILKKEGKKMHAHFGDPLVVEGSYFYRLPHEKKGVTVEEGYRVFDLDNPSEVIDISGIALGQAQVTATKQTKLLFLTEQDFRVIKKAGLKSKEEMIRILGTRYGKKKIEWITFVWFIPVVRLVNRDFTRKGKIQKEVPRE